MKVFEANSVVNGRAVNFRDPRPPVLTTKRCIATRSDQLIIRCVKLTLYRYYAMDLERSAAEVLGVSQVSSFSATINNTRANDTYDVCATQFVHPSPRQNSETTAAWSEMELFATMPAKILPLRRHVLRSARAKM